MARRRRRSRKRSGVGRFFEGMAVLVLLVVILTFGFSIANRYAGAGSEDQVPSPAAGPPTEPAEKGNRDYDLARDRVLLVVENGCGVTGMARDFADAIRGPRFDVVDYRDADRYDYLETVIVTTERGRQGALELLRELEERFGVGELQLTSETIYGADMRLVLGADLADRWKAEAPRGESSR